MVKSAWTAERRAKQAVAIHRWKPWANSTGPKSEEGKQRSARNGLAGESRMGGAGLLRLIRKKVRDGHTVDAAFDAAFSGRKARRDW